MHKIILAIALFVTTFAARAQELRCEVDINASQIEGSSKENFQALKEAISEYMNNTQFTNAQFDNNERIECKLFFVFTEYTDNENYKGTLQIQSTRPVYNSSYNTTLINFKDGTIDFQWQQGTPLIFNQMSMESQLTAILNFWAYMIIANDFDSFSPRGGQQWYERAQAIVQQGQSSGDTGWKAFDDNKNRAAVLSAYTDPGTQGIRDLLYQYHRKGLDEMSVGADKGRQVITKSLDEVSKVYRSNPMSVALSMFKDAKLDELVNVYSKAPETERKDVYELLHNIYPTENQRLDQIRQPKRN